MEGAGVYVFACAPALVSFASQLKTMNMRFFLLTTCLAAVASAQAAPELLTNGSFETSTTGLLADDTTNTNGNGVGFKTLGAGNTQITGWTVGGGGIDYISDYWQSQDGDYSIDLSGGSAGSISQNVTGLTSGGKYFLSFYLAGNPDGPPAVKVAVASAGTLLTTYSYSVTPGTRTNMNWNQYGFYFQATGSSATISFATDPATAGNNTAYGPALDNASLTAAPAPAGALVFGLSLLRRRRRSK